MGAPPPAGMSMAGGAPSPTGWRVAAGIGGTILLIPGLVAIVTAGILIEDYIRGRFNDGRIAAFFAGAWLLGALAGLLGGRLLWRTLKGSLTVTDRVVTGIVLVVLILQVIFRILDNLTPLVHAAMRSFLIYAMQHEPVGSLPEAKSVRVWVAVMKTIATLNLTISPLWFLWCALRSGYSKGLLVRAVSMIGTAAVTLAILSYLYP